jgi:hypothetical protein
MILDERESMDAIDHILTTGKKGELANLLILGSKEFGF